MKYKFNIIIGNIFYIHYYYYYYYFFFYYLFYICNVKNKEISFSFFLFY